MSDQKLRLGEELISPLHSLYDGLRVDGRPRLAHIAESHPVWVVTRYQDARQVLSHPGVRRDARQAAVVVLWAAALFAWFFLSALYLQLVGGFDPFQVGLAFVPANLIMAVFSLGISGGLVSRFGIKWPLVAGLLLAAGGLLLLSRAPVGGAFTIDVLPGMLLFGVGAGIAINPMLLAATNGVATSDAGLASGIVNTSFAMGGALWLAVITCFAARYTGHLEATGTAPLAALNGGYNLAFLVAACLSAGAAIVGGALLRVRPTTS